MNGTEKKEGSNVIRLTGRIDSNNAQVVEQEILGQIDGQTDGGVSFDAADLTYISSAGLRILMKARKLLGDRPVSITNVSRDVYEILDTTGFTQLFEVRKAYRKISIEGLPVIGRGFRGTVYRIDDESIVKVYRGNDSIPMIENEKAMAQKAFLGGIPTAISFDIVKVGEDYGSVFELLNAKTFHELFCESRDREDEILEKYVGLLKLVHQTQMEPDAFPSCRQQYLDMLSTVRNPLGQERYERLHALLSAVPEAYTVVHGDIQLKNVMMVDSEAMLIDMDTLGLGNPVFEFAGLFVAYQSFKEDEPGNSDAFFGVSDERIEALWNRIADLYFDFPDEEMKREILDKIALTAAIRFLYLLESTDLKNGLLGERRIAHTLQHIDALSESVKSLAL